jgi:DNA modification methylase
MTEPEVGIKKEKITCLVPDGKNANKGTERGHRLLEKSLRQYGAGRSILVDKHGHIIAGNKTHEQAVDIGLEDVILVQTDGKQLVAVQRMDLDLETDQAARELAYFDNRSGELNLDWDLGQLLADAEALPEGLWTDDELAELLAQTGIEPEPPADAEPQVDRAAELQEKWQVAQGNLWRIGEHYLACGDCTDKAVVERVTRGKKVGAVVTDSPYGIERDGIENDDPKGLRGLFDNVLAIMPIESAVVINFQSPRLFPVWLDAIRAAGHKFERMLWMYKPNDETFPWRGWLQTSEAILVSSIGSPEWLRVDPFAHDCYSPTTLGSELPRGWGKVHASVKPLAVVQDLISRIGGDVFDPFVGSGTTIVACQNLHRRCMAIEIHPPYVAVCLQRMSDAFPDLEIEKLE